MRAFVTGSTGFVGINLIRELTASGWEVTALHRRGADLRYLRELPVSLVTGDVTDAASLRSAMPREVDAVFHVAGDTTLWRRQRQRQTEVNVGGTRNVAAVALEREARRLVHTSSIAAFVVAAHSPCRR